MKPASTASDPNRLFLSILLAGPLAWMTGCKPEGPGGGPSSATGTGAHPGYTLVQVLTSKTTDLIDLEARVVHRWTSAYGLAGGAHLLPGGNLLRTCILADNPFPAACPGGSGAAELLDWDGNQLWSYEFRDSKKTLHHDACPLPSGNVLMLGLEQVEKAELIELGRDPSRMKHDSMWFDYIIEVKPTGKSGGEIVWEWHMRDHLIQDFDPKQKNFGVVADHPERIDINFVEESVVARGGNTLAQLQSLGYVGGGGRPAATGQSPTPDWSHANSIAYHSGLDQIMISVRGLGELWIIDHGTTKDEAATGAGGRRGRGGRLLYRWGNPQTYQRGTPQDQRFFGQHDAQWIPDGVPGAGHILVFNNGDNRKDGSFSSIDEIEPPLRDDGSYAIEEGVAFGPEKPFWRFVAEPKEAFFSRFLSGVQRLANGNTLICSGMTTDIFEVTPEGKTVWKTQLTTQRQDPRPVGAGQGAGPGMAGPGRRPPPGARPRMFGPGGPQGGPQGAPPQAPSGPSPLGAGGARGAGGPQPGFRPRPPGGPGGRRPPPTPATAPGGAPTKGLFRALRYGIDHPAFQGRKLEPIALPVPGGGNQPAR